MHIMELITLLKQKGIYQNENQNEKDSLIFYKKMFSKQTRHIPEMMVFHIFLTKKYAEKSIKKSIEKVLKLFENTHPF